ncbi:hypothetical protein HETIRDRAFT_149291 [Heterobasidion irregulare TC 32-1]|uniref:Uncharacterized protein n=1 Tax=Heterobasidion irregulare (strain TC 32-1) TaxID=747525 RepID=W4KGD6_HETIT|nr:uncharacterized protein HETIRDRAFT_149291 [Heterobasidion irregulare TC 32-1]ETW84902.1 hypothetical protein HETIRDRAFT_149291 [Heterobasidion irregulare TC 32-1]
MVAARPPGRAWCLQSSRATRRARRRRSTPMPRCEPHPRRRVPTAQQRDLRLCAAQSALSLTLMPGNFLAAALISTCGRGLLITHVL